MAMTSLRESKAFVNVLEAAAGPHQLTLLIEKWSDAARAAAAAARRAKSKGGNWRRAAWQTYATASGEAKIGGKGRAGGKRQGFEKWAERRAGVKADTAGSSRRQATFLDRHEAIVNTRKQGILDKMRGKNTAAARLGHAFTRDDSGDAIGAKSTFNKLINAPIQHRSRGRTTFRRGGLARASAR